MSRSCFAAVARLQQAVAGSNPKWLLGHKSPIARLNVGRNGGGNATGEGVPPPRSGRRLQGTGHHYGDLHRHLHEFRLRSRRLLLLLQLQATPIAISFLLSGWPPGGSEANVGPLRSRKGKQKRITWGNEWESLRTKNNKDRKSEAFCVMHGSTCLDTRLNSNLSDDLKFNKRRSKRDLVNIGVRCFPFTFL